ncbi:uncharacterized protein LOC111066660 isoform X2 [Drosophila obscura]|uniref:uncharacterized protein LOC111066660 isoform X2 n=1 Tax=Drosophila obscura TaxID=7282 RepID=UPI001BB19D99|nr:uncharacterized protein LOC111066660 isoform X2 [Drosophila obscura]
MTTHQVVFLTFVLSSLLIQASVQKSEFQDAMKKMGKNMKIAIQMGNELERNSNVKPFMDPPTYSPDQKVFNIQPDKNALIRFSYSQPQGHQPSASSSGKRRQQPKYFLNFNFQNRPNSKTTVDQRSPTIQARTLRDRGKRLRNGMPNPYKYFPLKGEHISQ